MYEISFNSTIGVLIKPLSNIYLTKKQDSEAAVKNDSAVTTPSPHIYDSLKSEQIS